MRTVLVPVSRELVGRLPADEILAAIAAHAREALHDDMATLVMRAMPRETQVELDGRVVYFDDFNVIPVKVWTTDA